MVANPRRASRTTAKKCRVLLRANRTSSIYFQNLSAGLLTLAAARFRGGYLFTIRIDALCNYSEQGQHEEQIGNGDKETTASDMEREASLETMESEGKACR